MREYNINALTRLAENFGNMPGVGKKTAHRLAYSILKMSDAQAKEFASAILEAKRDIHYCKICCNFTDKDICSICSDEKRDKTIICVVEDPKDVEAFERTKEFSSLYHVLHGVISPLNGIGPDQICIKQLLSRVNSGKVSEVIMACNPTVEGEATAMYISKILKPFDVKVTRLAYGVPVGASLEYADEITLTRALQGRSEI